jgi:hypothetical protein
MGFLMNKVFSGIALALLIFVSTSSSALAQRANYPQVRGNGWHRGWFRDDDRNDVDFHRRYGLNNGNWNSGNWNNGGRNGGWRGGTTLDGANPAAIAQFDARANQVRAEINSRTAGGARSARLSGELDSLFAMRARYMSFGRTLTVNELEQLNARLNQLRIGLRSRVYF